MSNSCVTVTRKTQDKDDIHIIILGGILGRRTRSLGPTPTVKFKNNKTLLEYQLEILDNKYPNADKILTIGYQSDRAIKKKLSAVRIVENQLFEETSCVEELRLALNNCIYDKVIILYADLLFNLESLERLTDYGSAVIIKNDDSLDKNEVGATIINNYITIFSFGLSQKWAKIIFLTEPELSILRDICFDRTKTTFCIHEIFNLVLENGGKFRALMPAGSQITRLDTIKKLNENIN